MRRLALAAVFMLLAIPAAGTGSPLEVSTFCHEFVSWMRVTNMSEETVHVYAYPLSDGEGAVEQTIDPGASLTRPGEGDFIVYLLVEKDWTEFNTGTLPECGDPDAPPPCHECGADTTIPIETTTTVPVEETTTTEETATTEAEVVAETTTTAAEPTADTLTELPFTGQHDNLMFVAFAVLALGVVLVIATREET